jgi:hypothetical protein
MASKSTYNVKSKIADSVKINIDKTIKEVYNNTFKVGGL